MHELCHLKYPDHSLRFRQLFSQCMPDWKLYQARLRTRGTTPVIGEGVGLFWDK
ncbi:MAG TPA: hypothetical protein DDZ83_16750 [Nitrospinae bacterium]|nr:hypothetical protein [Nitrospinota bacterium]